jgi:hypothetical protein
LSDNYFGPSLQRQGRRVIFIKRVQTIDKASKFESRKLLHLFFSKLGWPAYGKSQPRLLAMVKWTRLLLDSQYYSLFFPSGEQSDQDAGLSGTLVAFRCFVKYNL